MTSWTSTARLFESLRSYLDPKIRWSEVTKIAPGLTHPAGGFVPADARKRLLRDEKFEESSIRRYALYPMDVRWCYHSSAQPMWNRARPDLVAQAWAGNRFFVARMFAERPQEWVPVTMTSHPPDYHLLRPNAVAIPLQLRHQTEVRSGETKRLGFGSEQEDDQPKANLSAGARAYLKSIGLKNPDKDASSASLIWLHSLAVVHSPAYLMENADGVRGDYPRIPLPATLDLLRESAKLGGALAAHLDADVSDPGVTSGTLRPELRLTGKPVRRPGGAINASRGDLRVTAGWGHHGRDDVVMPGRGEVDERTYSSEEETALERLVPGTALRLGPKTYDVCLNDDTYLANVPARVWDYTIGGYQVLKKWLSYREEGILGRSLTIDELRLFSELVRRIAAIVLMEPQLDDVYERVKVSAYTWTPS